MTEKYYQTEQLQDLVKSLWTAEDICKRYHVSQMTVSLWRRFHGLPSVALSKNWGGPNYYYVPSDVRSWRKANGY